MISNTLILKCDFFSHSVSPSQDSTRAAAAAAAAAAAEQPG